jgi:hypothetical protein
MSLIESFRGLAKPSEDGQRSPIAMLMLMAFAVPLSFAIWRTMLDNFAIDQAGFTGREIGILQSLREIPGFLTFLFVFIIIFIREQRFGILSLGLLGIGTALTGFFPSVVGLYATTVLMSIGFHYYETANQSLTLQWVEKERAPQTIGKIMAIGSFASLIAYGIIFLTRLVLDLDYKWIYLIGGGITTLIAVYVYFAYPMYESKVKQRKELVLRKRYWLYYALTFMSGARRQIFVVFAGYMMVERFGFPVLAMTTLYLTNHLVNMYLATKIGQFIYKWGERRSLLIEYTGLIVVFSSYGIIAGLPVDTFDNIGTLPMISRFFCHGHGNQNLFPKDRRPGRHRADGGRCLFHQPYRGSFPTGDLGARVDLFKCGCVLDRRRHGLHLAGPRPAGPAPS